MEKPKPQVKEKLVQKEIKHCHMCHKYLPEGTIAILIDDSGDINYYKCEYCQKSNRGV